MKKFLSIVLSILMVVTMLPMAVLPASAAVTSKNSTLGITLYMDEALCSHNEQQPVDTIYTSTSLGYKEEYRLTYEYSDNDLVIEYYYGVSHAGHSADGVRTSFTVPDFSCEKTYNQKFTTANGSIVTFRRSAGHAVSSWTNNNNGTHSGICSFCGAVTVNCTYSEATCVAPKTCITCGATKGDIDATAHSWANNDGICANGCGATCAHENQTGSVCEICGEHICNYNNGFCTECDAYEPAELKDGYYQIKNGGNLFWYANYINTVDRTANAVLVADIDLENRPWTPIGSTGENSNNFRGIFDGQYYNIKGLYVEGDRAGLGFFGEVRTGTVKNFIIFGEVVVNTEVDYVGGVIGSICGVNGETDLERNGAIIQNINSYVNLTVKAHGVGKIGGFVGYANHQSLIEHCAWYGTFDAGEYRVDSGAGGFIGKIQENTSEVTIRNCAAYGTIKTNYAGDYNDTATIYMGGFLSFSNTNAKTTVENCLFAGKFERGENLTDQAFLGAFGTLRSVNAIKNCYYLGDDGLEAVHSDSPMKPGSDNVEITKVTGEELKSGKIATQLGKLWSQGEDYPILKELSPHSHSYTYTDNGDGTHDQVCPVCDYVEVDNEAHTPADNATYTDNGDGTHSFTCGDCGVAVAEVPHTLDVTTGKCSACGTDMTAIATVTDSTNTYYAADAATLNQAVTAILETGSRTFTVELPADTEAEMITAIRRAICDTEGVADGSINLTLKGVTSIPGTTNWDGVAFGPGDIYDEAGEIVDQELITQLASVNLPDATEIGAQAFYFCENLVAVSAPKAQTIGAQALGYTALTSVEFPELTTIPTDMFSGTWTLSSAKFPKVTTIEQNGLLVGAKFNPENNPTPFPLELTAEGDITFNGSNHFNIASQNYSGKVDLVLNIDKKEQVTFNDDGTATWQVRDDLSYTFKSITFTCTDGTTNHSYTYTDNGDGTHDKECLFCDYVEVDNEAHSGGTATCKEQAKCEHCGASYGEVDADGHDWSNKDGICANCCGETCPHSSYTDGVCDKCDYECPHEWDEGVLTRPVYDAVLGSKDGYYTYTCTVCGEEKTETVKSADYSAYEAVSEEINVLLQSEELTPEAKQAIYSAANECGHLSNDLTESEQNIVDDLVAELEKIIADADEKIASGEYVKIDGMKEYNKIADALDAELMENYSQEEIAALAEKAGDEINARFGEIIEKAEALTGTVAENKDALAEIESEMRALYGEIKNCLDGVHNGLVYEVTEEAKCEVNAIESATCTLCGETDEREIEGTALEHEPNEQMCKGYWCSRCRSFYGEGNPDIHLDGYSSTGKIKDGQCDGCNKQLAFIKSGETYEINSYAHVVEFAPVVDGRYILTVDGPEGTEIDVREVVDGVNKGINCEVISDLVYVVDCTVGKIYRFEASNYYGYNISSMTLECETHKGTVQTCYGYICDACGEYFGEVPGHDIIIDEAVPPTCTQTGLTEGQHCSRCDDMTIIQEKVPATNHKDTLVKVDAKAATCTEAGWEAYEYCTACDYTTYEEIPALKHSFTKYEVTEEAECGKAGKEVAYCDHGCQTTDEREIPALKHSFTKYEVAEEAECGKTGKEVAYCDHGCGATDENEIPALKHEPLAAVVENEVAAECEKAGSYDLVVYCNLCGEELDRDTTTVAATGHADNDGDYKCDYGCGHEFEKPVDPTPDTPNTPDEPTDDTCDHICHSNNALMKFLWKIISFFYRLFNIQQYCDCGVIHYDTPVFG